MSSPETNSKRARSDEPEASTKKVKISRTYEELAALCKQDPRFHDRYEARPRTWVSTSTMKKSSKAQYKRVVALDCEMCVTLSERRDDRDSHALVRVTLIDGEDPDVILVDLIVHQPPPGRIIYDYKTDIHGLSGELIFGSKIDVARARKEVLKHLGPDTVLVGHSVDGDLASMMIHHSNCLDTALLYKRMDVPEIKSTPGLRELTVQLLKIEMPPVHDSFLDAKMTMLAAQYALTNPIGPVIVYKAPATTWGPPPSEPSANEPGAKPLTMPPRIKSSAKPAARAPVMALPRPGQDDGPAAQWVIHRIPKGIFNSDIQSFVTKTTSVVPEMVENVVFKSQWGSCSVNFPSAMHANLAFAMLTGDESKDPLDRVVKKVEVPNKAGTIYKGIKIMTAKK
ncbi:hypothetical protein SDRG_10643 [Saprolegnia diclina VS20]|uniref:Exonuclease domain-containing protein n=1 Tax=Saprolegnia diclina (strain VS20) TaxID=1156394 RepID=T0Q1Z7_SAPDV|nr:hypothetical protein SDRG_10643 [Saprolegnia diclina VS20]EQC31859.1 hypothetical protein SDRG_10643 [Saprolegnia diclina VS20]|eukprot:XP_008614866.1 hypothetical protein SDRG_10643 [Saprolegnia diclina VS20]